MTNNGPYYAKTFEVHLGDTSAYGNAYYLTYHRWIAFTKEDFFIEKVKGFSDLFSRQGIKLFVLKSSLRIFGECKLHDKVEIRMSCLRVKKLKAELLFKCHKLNGHEVAESENIIVFVDKDNQLLSIPEEIRSSLLEVSQRG